MIGIDVGGANLKVVDGKGTHIHPCPLWKKAPLEDLLRQYPPEPAAVVMTGELADCFEDKWEGIRWIVDTVREVFPDALFYGTDGRFHQDAVPVLSAANWLASADFLLPRYPGTVLVDMGSTTTDIIPLQRMDDLRGLTDLDRLRKGYLVYQGFLRTTIPAFVSEIAIKGSSVPVSSENFAITADVHLVLGDITPAGYTCDTPDGTGRDIESAGRRIARLVCADPQEIGGDEGVRAVAEEIREKEKERITGALQRVQRETGARGVLCAGIGGRHYISHLRGTDLYREIGPGADALPAYAVREVALRNERRSLQSCSSDR